MRLALAPSEWLFTRGQRLLSADPAAAAEAFADAARARPRDAQVLLWQGMALAQNGRAEEAIARVEQAIALEPRNAVFPAEIAVLHLDEGRPADARPWLARAEALAPGHALLEAWTLLARWDEGDGAAAAALATRTRDRAVRFGARVLLRTERHFLAGTRPGVPRDASPPPRNRPPDPWDRLWVAPRARSRARALIARGHHDAAASVLLQAREDFAGEELLDGLLQPALTGALNELTGELQALAKERAAAPPVSPASNVLVRLWRRVRPPRDFEAERRDVVFRLADALLQLERWSEAAPRLDDWYASWEAAPPRVRLGEEHYAIALALAASETASRLRRWDEALLWCERARALDADRKELLRAEALARTGRGEDRAARRLFERLLGTSLYSAEDRLRELITGRRAFIST